MKRILAAIALWTFSLVLFGCGLTMVGDPVQKQDIISENDAEENLKAIRAILQDQEKRSASPPAPPPDAEPLPSSETQPSSQPNIINPSTSPSPSSRRQFDAPAKLPWTPPAIRQPSPPDRSVPAYTIPAPVGPDYAGSIRCAPDGLGGQRCFR